jgi:endo-1,4-beta-D-glucanase Y
LALAAGACAKDPDDGTDDGGDEDNPPVGCTGSGSVAQPFGNHELDYASGSILPDHVSQADLDEAVRVAYDIWKNRYIDEACTSGQYLVATGMGEARTVSEAHGYGMVITAFMAGHDPQARTIFDGLVRYFRAHPTESSPDLMAWSQDSQCNDNRGQSSATDGDLDIAYALLLADKQWGSDGAIDYRSEATKVIRALRNQNVDNSASYVLLGDWPSPGTSEYDATRSSDFMPGHFRTFAAVGGNGDWTQIATRTYEVMATLQDEAASTTGLLPDFVLDPTGSPQPAGADFLEGDNDGAYSYNACRDPWRIALDFLISGDSRAKTAVQKINDWIESETGGDPGAIRAGYRLNGQPIGDYFDMAFVAPKISGYVASRAVEQYAVAIAQATRVDRDLRLGASPRATLQLVRAAKARAALDGREFVLPDDIDALAVPVLGHRLIPARRVGASSSVLSGSSLADIVSRIVAETPVPLSAAGPA